MTRGLSCQALARPVVEAAGVEVPVMDKQITIRMPKELLAKWLAALRSGKYRQTTDVLYDGYNGYCCLGVLQKEAEGNVTEQEGRIQLPPLEWLSAHGISFASRYPEDKQDAPFLPSLKMRADAANDAGKTFNAIADAIEACAEGF